jgi:hypothetical protein
LNYLGKSTARYICWKYCLLLFFFDVGFYVYPILLYFDVRRKVAKIT